MIDPVFRLFSDFSRESIDGDRKGCYNNTIFIVTFVFGGRMNVGC